MQGHLDHVEQGLRPAPGIVDSTRPNGTTDPDGTTAATAAGPDPRTTGPDGTAG
jgi:hypothetical protein